MSRRGGRGPWDQYAASRRRMAPGGTIYSESPIRRVVPPQDVTEEATTPVVNPASLFWNTSRYTIGQYDSTTMDLQYTLDNFVHPVAGDTIVAIVICRSHRYWNVPPAGWAYLGANTSGWLDVQVYATTYTPGVTNTVFSGDHTPVDDADGHNTHGIYVSRFSAAPGGLTVGLAGFTQTANTTTHPWPGTPGFNFPIMVAMPVDFSLTGTAGFIWTLSEPPTTLTRSIATANGRITMIIVPYTIPLTIRTGVPQFVTTFTSYAPCYTVTPILEWV